MHLLPLLLGLASPVSGCYSAYQKREGAPSMEELMNEQKPQCRVQASEKPRRGWCSFPHCGLEYKQLFSCCTSMLCLPTAPLGHIFLLMQPILGKPFSNSSSSVLLTYYSFLPSLCFKILLLFSPLGFPFSFFWTYLLCSFFFLTTLSLGPPT